MAEECPLCEHADRFDLEEGIASGTLLKTSVANQLEMTNEEVYEHMSNHLSLSRVSRHTREILPGLDDQYSKYDMLFNNVVDLNSLLGSFIQTAMETPDAANISRLVKLAQEVRSSINDLAKLKGEIASETKITYIQYNQLKAVVMGNLCKACRTKVVDELESGDFNKAFREMKK